MNSVLKGKNVLLGITGSIAAYKAAEIVRLLRKRGTAVFPIMTSSATHFVHPITFQTLASQKVTLKLFDKNNKQMGHLSLPRLADLLLIAPASANVIGKIASGIADEILTTIVLATEAPVVIAPAMDHGMYQSPILQRNISKLKTAGYRFIGPEKGDLASGEVGMGRMTEPSKIVEYLKKLFQSRDDFRGKTFLVTAGPTRERLDTVRFFSNYSSGKMGYALAEEGGWRGAKIILVSGPSSLTPPAGVEFYQVESAQEMYDTVMDKFPQVDGVLMAAAVSDYRPARHWQNKIKKESREKLVVELVQNPDILKELGEKKANKILVGFCAETKDLEKEARKKLMTKDLDLVVANDITLEGAGFEVDTNVVTLIDGEGKKEALSKRSKREVAQKVWDKIKWLMEARKITREIT